MNFGSMITVFNLQTKRSLEDTRSEKSKNGMWSSFWWNLQGSTATDIPMFQPPSKILAIWDRIRWQIKMRSSPPLLKLKPASSRPPTQSFRLSIIYRFAWHSELHHWPHERGFQSGRQARRTSIILVTQRMPPPRMDLLLWKLLTTPLGRVEQP